MCGLGAILVVHRGAARRAEDVIPEAWLDALDAGVAHRGPDGAGRLRDRAVRADGAVVDVALAHRRLSIIDHAGGAQPMAHDGARLRPDCVYTPGGATRLGPERHAGRRLVAVAFNGCVYDHADRRAELERLGHTFGTDHSDTEVLVHGWRAWGARVFDRIEGMFACAVWDREAGTLMLARDRFGEKPLFLRQIRRGAEETVWIAASVASAAALAGPEAARVDPNGVVEALVRGYGVWRTPYEGVGSLAPGEWVRLGGARVEREPVGSLPSPRRGGGGGARRVGRLLEESVRDRLSADVPVACLLSGGVDSSAVALAATRVLGDASRLTTVCVRMPAVRYDESVYAADVARALGTRHLTVDASASPAADMVGLIESLGLPFGDSSLLPTSWAFAAVRREAKVALTGDGGDELFLGYQRYRGADRLRWLWALRALGVGAPAWALPRRDPRGAGDKAARFLVAGLGAGYRDLLDIFPGPDARRVVRQPREVIEVRAWVADALDARLLDLREHLPGDLLFKVDHASMARGVEARAPMLAREVTRAALGAGRSVRGKRPLRGYLARHLPAGARRAVLGRGKRGFAIPVGEWFRSDAGGMRALLRDALESVDAFDLSRSAGAELDRRAIGRMLEEHDAAGEKSPWPWRGRDHGQRLYALLSLAIWERWYRGASQKVVPTVRK